MSGQTVDQILGGRVTITQPAHGYRAAIDAVLLAAAVAVKPGAMVLDAGCGVGTASLCLLARLPQSHIHGLEIQPLLAGCAVAGRAEPHGRLHVTIGDLARPPYRPQSFDHVMSNPPYLDPQRHRPPPDAIHALADAESHLPLADWLSALDHLLKPGGGLTVIHRADRLPELLRHWPASHGALAIQPIQPHADSTAQRVILQSIKGRRSPAILLPALILHQTAGGWTAAAERILTAAEPLPMMARERR